MPTTSKLTRHIVALKLAQNKLRLTDSVSWYYYEGYLDRLAGRLIEVHDLELRQAYLLGRIDAAGDFNDNNE